MTNEETEYVICTAGGECYHRAMYHESRWGGANYFVAACGCISTASHTAYVVLPDTNWAKSKRPCQRCYPGTSPTLKAET